jgi:hypothetical protein
MLEGEFLFAALGGRPMQQAMGIEGVVDAVARIEGESQLGATSTNGFAIGCQLLRRRAVLARQMFADIFALGGKCSSTSMSPATRAIAASSDLRPMAHQGQTTSETKSIFNGSGLAAEVMGSTRGRRYSNRCGFASRNQAMLIRPTTCIDSVADRLMTTAWMQEVEPRLQLRSRVDPRSKGRKPANQERPSATVPCVAMHMDVRVSRAQDAPERPLPSPSMAIPLKASAPARPHSVAP